MLVRAFGPWLTVMSSSTLLHIVVVALPTFFSDWLPSRDPTPLRLRTRERQISSLHACSVIVRVASL